MQLSRNTARTVAAFAGAVLLWMIFVSSVAWQELATGALCAALTTAFMLFVSHRTQDPRRFLLRDVAQIRRVPLAVLQDVLLVTRLLLKTLLTGKAAPAAGYRCAAFAPGGTWAVREGRKALAVIYTTASPNSLALGVDDHAGCMVVHQLAPAPLPRVLAPLALGKGDQ